MRKDYVRALRILAWGSVVGMSMLVVMTTYGRVSPWGQ